MSAQGRGRTQQTSTNPSLQNKKRTRLPAVPIVALLLLPVIAFLYPSLQTTVVVLTVLNAVTFLLYWKDKSAAMKGLRRVPEAHLHMMGLFGGWPGAWLAQHLFRHKTMKVAFRVAFWLTVTVNISVGLLLLRQFLWLA